MIRLFKRLKEPDISPGPWFRSYAEDFALAHYIPEYAINECLTSGIVEGAKGWIWATATPSWDRDWFESRGFKFPKRWVTWESIQGYLGKSGDYVKLDV